MLQNPTVIFIVVAGVLLAFRVWQGRKEASEAEPPVAPEVAEPKPFGDAFMRVLSVLGELKLEPLVGDILRALFRGNLAEAESKAQATVDNVATPKGAHAALQGLFEQQLDSRLADPEQYATIAAKVKQEATKAA